MCDREQTSLPLAPLSKLPEDRLRQTSLPLGLFTRGETTPRQTGVRVIENRQAYPCYPRWGTRVCVCVCVSLRTNKPSPGTSLEVTRGQTTLSELVCVCLSVIENRKSTPKTDHVENKRKSLPLAPPPPISFRGKTCPPTPANKPLFRTQEIVRSPYAIALALFFAVRSRSPSRTSVCSSSLLILPYHLTCSNGARYSYTK